MSDYWAKQFLLGCIKSWDADPMWKGYLDPEAVLACARLWRALNPVWGDLK